MAEDLHSHRYETVTGCSRCGQTHEKLCFTKLNNPPDEWEWWALCPTIQQPILMKVIKTEVEE